MKIQQFFLYAAFFAFWLLSGCTKTDTPVSTERPRLSSGNELDTVAGNQSPLFDANIYYNENRLEEALEIAEKLLVKQPDHGGALFLKAMIQIKKNQYQAASETVKLIPQNSRLALTESCMELIKLHKKISSGEVLTLAIDHFPECAEEFNEEESAQQPDDSGFSYFDIIRIGKLYEQQILQENDANVRRVREEIFLKDHTLTKEQISEISARYLEFMARE